MKNLAFLSLVILVFGCRQQAQVPIAQNKAVPVDTNRTLTTIAFGSCNEEDLPQPMWEPILQNNPDLWIWLGDIIYGDSENPTVLLAKYDKQRANPSYGKLWTSTPIIGIWDDHDYGTNDGDKHYPIKKDSKSLLLNFLDVPTDAPVRNREGAYQSYTFGTGANKVKILLLDARYFRDTLQRTGLTDGQRYFKNETGDILGEAQWQWLEQELVNSEARVHIIGSGIQVIPEEHFFEKWANFPLARKRLLDLLVTTQARNAIFISGDRHLAEISTIELPGLPYPVYDITSSGLTHSFEQIEQIGELNRHREGDKLTGKKNFGVIRIDWEAQPLEIKVEIRGLGNALIFDSTLQFE